MARTADDLATETRCEQMVPPWISRMRKMAQKHLTEDVVEEIVKAQIDRAKKGDRNAIKFVFDQLMGGQSLKGATFIQNNYGSESSERPGPTDALPGSDDKILAMQRRMERRENLTRADDATRRLD